MHPYWKLRQTIKNAKTRMRETREGIKAARDQFVDNAVDRVFGATTRLHPFSAVFRDMTAVLERQQVFGVVAGREILAIYDSELYAPIRAEIEKTSKLNALMGNARHICHCIAQIPQRVTELEEANTVSDFIKRLGLIGHILSDLRAYSASPARAPQLPRYSERKDRYAPAYRTKDIHTRRFLELFDERMATMSGELNDSLQRVADTVERMRKTVEKQYQDAELTKTKLTEQEQRISGMVAEVRTLIDDQRRQMTVLEQAFADKTAQTSQAMDVMKQSIDILQQQNTALMSVASGGIGEDDPTKALLTALKEIIK